jgi:hypothetical protein
LPKIFLISSGIYFNRFIHAVNLNLFHKNANDKMSRLFKFFKETSPF